MNSQAAAQTPPPEADLIRRAREARNLSPEAAAARMEIKFSGSRWRQIEAGYRKDLHRQVIAKDPVLAHMAFAIGVMTSELSEAGRDEAAKILARIKRDKTRPPLASEVPHPEHAPPAPADVDAEIEERVEWFRKLPLDKKMKAFRELFDDIHRGIDASREDDGGQRPAG